MELSCGGVGSGGEGGLGWAVWVVSGVGSDVNVLAHLASSSRAPHFPSHPNSTSHPIQHLTHPSLVSCHACSPPMSQMLKVISSEPPRKLTLFSIKLTPVRAVG
jgi:hypothetical protein